MKNGIESHYKKIVKHADTAQVRIVSKNTCCNQKKDECPLKDYYIQDNVVYQGTVTNENKTLKETYVG